jgi:sugar lactone lactonase YvrE
MICRQRIRIYCYFAIVILTASLVSILWPGENSIVPVAASAQDLLWREITPDSLDSVRNNQRLRIAPRQHKAFQLNETALTSLLADAPMEFTEAAKDPRIEITLPMPDGSFARFRFVESPIMEPALLAQFPKIKTYQGWGIDDPAAKTRFSHTSDGFHAIVLSPKGASYVTPLFRGDARAYASYFMRDAGQDAGEWCTVSSGDRAPLQPERNAPRQPARLGGPPSNGATLRTFRLAVAATGEYTGFFGGSVAGAMSAIATTVNNLNAIYQSELAVRFTLIGANASLIFTNAQTDPYTSGNKNKLLDKNQEYLDKTIGGKNYDIGQVFDMNSAGGRATVGVVCDDGDKGRGTSGTTTPTGAGFDLLVAHEFGHQFGANHTFNGTFPQCNDENRNEDTAYEPGSGSTIMAYAGVCGSDNLQPGPDPYFHGASLAEMVRYLDNECGCAATSSTNNTPPNVTPPLPVFPTPLGHFLIPKRTPFALTATAIDAQDPNITFCWEGLDHGSPGPTPGDRIDNPLFRSWPPTSNPTRTFPSLANVLSGTTTIKGEMLPNTQRSMGFRVTARDNHSPNGGFDQGDVAVDVWAYAGPFIVTRPAAGAQALEGGSFTVMWDVAGTNAQPINTANVRILLSTDNGASFPVTLAESAPNNGAFSFTVPRGSSTQARIKVEAIDNIFFNISPAFTIISKPTISPLSVLTVARGMETTAPVATVEDDRDPAGALIVATTLDLPPPTGVTISDITTNNGVISVKAHAQCFAAEGVHPIGLIVTNSAGLWSTTTFNLRVDQNPAPTLGYYSNATVGAAQSIQASPSAPPDDPSDPNGNRGVVTVSPQSLSGGSGTIVVDQTTGVVTIPTYRDTQRGRHLIQVQVTNACGSVVTRGFYLDVGNTPPRILLNGNSVHTTQDGTSLAPVAIAAVTDNQQDAPSDLIVSATALSGLEVRATNSPDGTIRATATATCAVPPGAYNATLTVTDSEGAAATADFPVIVDPNPPPIPGQYNNTGVTVGGLVHIIPFPAPSDPNNAITLSVSPGALPGGGTITIDQTAGPNYGSVTVNTLSNTTLGAYPVTVTAVDACGATASRTFNLTVRSATCSTEHNLSFVADTNNHHIQRFDGVSWTLVGSGVRGGGLGQFDSPEAVVASGDGQLVYVADTGNRRIQWSQDGGATWAVFASNLTPRGLALDRDGNLYASDALDNWVVRYSGGVPGSPVGLAMSGSGSGQVSNPNGLAIDCRMNLYIADTGNNRILVVGTADATMIPNTGTVVAAPGAGLNPAQVWRPEGVAVDDTGNLYVADTGNNRVLLITSAPASGAATELCAAGSQPGQARGPEGVTVVAFKTGVSWLVVSDTSNNRIQASTLPVGAWTLLSPPAGGGLFDHPSKIR